MPPTGQRWDLQLGGPKDLGAQDVSVIERDRRAPPAGDYPICYVNAFQTQPDEADRWLGSDLILTREGEPVVDEVWGEFLLDISTPDKRDALADIVGGWIEGCAADGFAAVELDNLDSYLRSDGLLAEADADAYAAQLVAIAHESGLAAAQKNRAGWDGTAVGFDFAVVEECGAFDECEAYVAAYEDAVFIVEYTDEGFVAACEAHGDRLSIVRRDVDLAPDGTREWC